MHPLPYLIVVISVCLELGEIHGESTCGLSSVQHKIISDRIVGGRIAFEAEFPWQGSLRRKDWFGYHHICGCAILNEKWVVTAAHCITGSSASNYQVLVGATNLTQASLRSNIYSVSLIVIRRGYNPYNFNNDIALVKLKTDITIDKSDGTNSICLPQTSQKLFPSAVVAGWGSTKEGGKRSDILHVVEVPILPRRECVALYGEENITPSMMCAGYEYGEKDSCQGDSGGPLIQYVDGTAFIIGLVSWGVGCAQAYRPGVYTNVTHFSSWIKESIGRYTDY